MKRISFISLILMALAIFLSASSSLASSIICDVVGQYDNRTVYLGSGGKITEYLSPGGPSFTYTAISPGPFKVETPFGGGISFNCYIPHDTHETSIHFQDSFSWQVRCDIHQDQPGYGEKLIFTSASISATVGDITLTAVADPNMLVDIWNWPPGADYIYGGGMLIELGGSADITVPIIWHEILYSDDRYGEASASVAFITGTFTLEGNVAVVPIPSALLLLGSGLAGLVFYRGRKIAS